MRIATQTPWHVLEANVVLSPESKLKYTYSDLQRAVRAGGRSFSIDDLYELAVNCFDIHDFFANCGPQPSIDAEDSLIAIRAEDSTFWEIRAQPAIDLAKFVAYAKRTDGTPHWVVRGRLVAIEE